MENQAKKKGIIARSFGYLKRRPFYSLLAISCFVAVISLILSSYYDSDTSFILAEGKNIIQNGIPYYNTFTVEKGLRTVVQQWLFDIIVYFFYGKFGMPAIFCIVLAGLIINSALAFYLMRLKGSDADMSLVGTVIFIVLIKDYLTCRPNMVTVALLVLEIIFMEKYKITGKAKYVYFNIPLILLEMNLHMSMWIFHFVFLLPYIVPPVNKIFSLKLNLFEKRTYKIKPILISLPFMAAACFVNPYGFDGVMYIFRSVASGLTDLNILEMMKITFLDSDGILGIAGIAVITAVICKDRGKINAETLYMFAGTLILGMMYYRNVFFYAIGALLFFSEYFARLKNKKARAFHTEINQKHKVLIAAGVLLLAFSIGFSVHNGAFKFEDDATYPLKAVEFLESHNERGTSVYTQYNSGAYMELQGYKIYIDARVEPYSKKINKKDDIIGEYKNVINTMSPGEYKDFKEKYKFKYYLCEKYSIMDYMLTFDKNADQVVNGNGYRLYKMNE